MGTQIHFSNPHILCKTKSAEHLPPFSTVVQLHPKLRVAKTVTLSSNKQYPISSTAVPQTQPDAPVSTVQFKTLGACKLGISNYPDFGYNATGGKGTGTCTSLTNDEFKGDTAVDFDVKTLYIPPLTTATTKFLGLPLPPFLRIDIVPQIFKGNINSKSGEVNLEFKAKFLFSIGSIYKAPPLLVETVLTSEESNGRMRNGRGERLNAEGKCRLVQ